MSTLVSVLISLAAVAAEPGTRNAAKGAELFPGKDLGAWREPIGEWLIAGEVAIDPQDSKALVWKPGSGVAVNGPKGRSVNLVSKRQFGDAEVHVEFLIPAKSNSGVYLMGRYEIQVYDSHGVAKDEYPGIECGGIYPRWVNNQAIEGHSPRVNASLPPGQWQTFDITFRAPRFDSAGKKTQNAKFIKVVHNGKTIHENVEVTGPTRAAIFADEKPFGPIMLQGDHGPVAYRRVRIRPLAGEAKAVGGAMAKIPGLRVERDLEYVPGGHARQKLDLYLPAKVGGPLPLVVWIHGGAWQGGNKEGCPAVPMVAKGYAVASINYRLSQHALFPAQIEDCKAAIRWLRANAEKYGLDAKHVGVWGASAGGHLVALLGTAGGVKELDGNEGNLDQSSRVQCVVDWFGPTDFSKMGGWQDKPDSPMAKLIGGPVGQNQEKAAKANPISYITKDAAPFLIIHGEDDKVVPMNQSELLDEALRKAGVESTLVRIPGNGHGGPGFTNPESRKRIAEFFEKHLK